MNILTQIRTLIHVGGTCRLESISNLNIPILNAEAIDQLQAFEIGISGAI